MPRTIRLLILATFALGCRERMDPNFIQLADARHLVTEMRVSFARSSDASDRAVMADTDAESEKFAREAELSANSVQATGVKLAARLADLGNREDAATLSAFDERFGRYRALDRQVLALAVENTNLKAQRLSFGPVRRAADDLSAALDAVVAAEPAADRCRSGDLAARAKLAIREIQILQAPHIAESQEGEMDRLEKDMAARQTTARTAIGALATKLAAAARAPLDRARAALDEFDRTSKELIGLSRRNSNVRSLELALRQKPALATACEESMAALETALAKEGFSGTR